MNRQIPSKRAVILMAIIVSIVIYFLGVLSGLFANKILERKVQDDLSKVEDTLGSLKHKMDTSALDIKNILLLQFYNENIEDKCEFSRLYMQNLYNEIKPYWDELPSSLEDYEKTTNHLSDDYISLKREYLRLSLRLWLTSKKNLEDCKNLDFFPILYFYSGDCENCETQAEMFDTFKSRMAEINHTVIVFPIDINFKDDTIHLLTKYYNISQVPAVVLQEEVHQGSVTNLSSLINWARKVIDSGK